MALLDAGLELLDREVVDSEGQLVGKVDDLLFEESEHGGPPELVALLVGQQAVGRRLGGRLGRWWMAVSVQLSGRFEGAAVPVERISELGPTVRINARVEEFSDLLRAERWLRRVLISRIPGADR